MAQMEKVSKERKKKMKQNDKIETVILKTARKKQQFFLF
jgi:hypothetical protein